MTNRTTKCTDCNGYGRLGFESAPGCTTWDGPCKSCNGKGKLVEQVESCDGCKQLTNVDSLRAFGTEEATKWLCPRCMQKALKTIALSETPIFHSDFRSTVESPVLSDEQLLSALRAAGHYFKPEPARAEEPIARTSSPGGDLKRTMEDKAFDVNQFVFGVAS